MMLYQHAINSPVGELTLTVTEAGDIRALLWPDHPENLVSLENRGDQVAAPTTSHPATVGTTFENTTHQIADYFDSRRTTFDLPLDLKGTDFQVETWQALQTISYGETSTYGQHAAALGRPKAARAIGAAIGRNPISIIVPCHRVVGASGSLTGFAGGLPTKSFLLELEQRQR